MRLIDRLYNYLDINNITAYAFEQKCGLSNGYLRKQKAGKGTVGSDVLEKILSNYADLSLIWLLTGEGEMLGTQAQPQAQPQAQLPKDKDLSKAKNKESNDPMSPGFVIKVLQSQIHVLTATVADKEEIISMLKDKLNTGETPNKG